jgi:hypothetical protein
MPRDAARRISAGSACSCCASWRAIRLQRGQLRATRPQIYSIGARSVPIVAVGGAFVGLVMSLQGYRTLETFGATSALGTLLGLSLFRELGPVLTAILFCGRAGSAMAAELGLMRATDQITALSMMAIDPVGKVVAPRFVAGRGQRAAADRGVLRLRHPRRLPAGGAGARRRRRLLLELAAQLIDLVEDFGQTFVKAAFLRPRLLADRHLRRLPRRTHHRGHLGRHHPLGGARFADGADVQLRAVGAAVPMRPVHGNRFPEVTP